MFGKQKASLVKGEYLNAPQLLPSSAPCTFSVKVPQPLDRLGSQEEQKTVQAKG